MIKKIFKKFRKKGVKANYKTLCPPASPVFNFYSGFFAINAFEILIMNTVYIYFHIIEGCVLSENIFW